MKETHKAKYQKHIVPIEVSVIDEASCIDTHTGDQDSQSPFRKELCS